MTVSEVFRAWLRLRPSLSPAATARPPHHQGATNGATNKERESEPPTHRQPISQSSHRPAARQQRAPYARRPTRLGWRVEVASSSVARDLAAGSRTRSCPAGMAFQGRAKGTTERVHPPACVLACTILCQSALRAAGAGGSSPASHVSRPRRKEIARSDDATRGTHTRAHTMLMQLAGGGGVALTDSSSVPLLHPPTSSRLSSIAARRR